MTNIKLLGHIESRRQLLSRKKSTSSSKCLLLKTLLFLLCIYLKRISAATSTSITSATSAHIQHSLTTSPTLGKCEPSNLRIKTPYGANHDLQPLVEEKYTDVDEHSLDLICPLDQFIKPACSGDYSRIKLKNCYFLLNSDTTNPSTKCTLKDFREHIFRVLEVTWLKNGNVIHRDNGNLISYGEPLQTIKSLTLFNVGDSDMGRYTCIANYSQVPPEAYKYFKLGISASFDLIAYKNGEKYLPDTQPIISHPPASQKERKGANVTFECKGFPTLLQASTYWFMCLYNDKNCITTFMTEFNNALEKHEADSLLKYAIKYAHEERLEVKNVSEENAGYYGCWQVNKRGVDIRLAKLDILDELTTYTPPLTIKPAEELLTTTYKPPKPDHFRNHTAENVIPLATMTTNEPNPINTWLFLTLVSALIIVFIMSLICFHSIIKEKNNRTSKHQNMNSAPSIGKNLVEHDNTKQHLPEPDCLDIYNIGKIHPTLTPKFISGNLMQPNGQFMTQSINNQILDEKDGRNSTIRSNNSDEASSWGKKSIISFTHGDFSRAFYLHTSEKTTSTVPLYDHPPLSTLTGRRTRQHHLCEPIVQDACVINPTYGFIRSDDGSDNMDGVDWSFPRRNLERLNKIGEGQFGEVWRYIARQKDGNESYVAVKQLKNRVGLGDRERLELIAEIEIMKSVNDHPNVIKLLNYCVDDHEPILLIMEYAEKGKLQTYLRSCRNNRKQQNMLYSYYASGSSAGGSDAYGDIQSSSGCSSGSPSSSTSGSIIHHNITSKELITFSYHIAKGMEYVASKGIIHRDLASRNILVSSDHHCKVADFGFARRITDDIAYERTTANPVPVKWMAPEALVENKFTSKSDVFSFGILMWEIVTLGATPYEYMNSSEVYKKVTSGGRLEKPAHCKQEFFNIMSQCWLHDPAKRPTFKDLAIQLDKLVKSENDYIELDQYPEHAYYNITNK